MLSTPWLALYKSAVGALPFSRRVKISKSREHFSSIPPSEFGRDRSQRLSKHCQSSRVCKFQCGLRGTCTMCYMSWCLKMKYPRYRYLSVSFRSVLFPSVFFTVHITWKTLSLFSLFCSIQFYSVLFCSIIYIILYSSLSLSLHLRFVQLQDHSPILFELGEAHIHTGTARWGKLGQSFVHDSFDGSQLRPFDPWSFQWKECFTEVFNPKRLLTGRSQSRVESRVESGVFRQSSSRGLSASE